MTSSRIWQILQVLLVGLLDYTCCDTNNFLAQRESISNRSHSKSVRYGETSGARVVRNVLQNTTIIDPLHEACKHSGKEDVSIIRCYLCKSNTKAQKEPKCDTKLWKYLKHSETTRLKTGCDQRAKFCYKMVVHRLGERITHRGCVGDKIHFGTREFDIRNGCVKTKSRDGHRTTVCLCDSDYCNVGGQNGVSKLLVVFLILSLIFIVS